MYSHNLNSLKSYRSQSLLSGLRYHQQRNSFFQTMKQHNTDDMTGKKNRFIICVEKHFLSARYNYICIRRRKIKQFFPFILPYKTTLNPAHSEMLMFAIYYKCGLAWWLYNARSPVHRYYSYNNNKNENSRKINECAVVWQ